MDFLTLLIAFSGLIFGKIIQIMTKKEAEEGRGYLEFSRKAILLVISAMFFVIGLKNYYSLIGFVLGILAAYSYRIRYFYLGIALVASYLISLDFTFLIIILIFAYGLLYGSLEKRIIIPFIAFLIPNLLLLFKIGGYDYLLFGFIAGSLFLRE